MTEINSQFKSIRIDPNCHFLIFQKNKSYFDFIEICKKEKSNKKRQTGKQVS